MLLDLEDRFYYYFLKYFIYEVFVCCLEGVVGPHVAMTFCTSPRLFNLDLKINQFLRKLEKEFFWIFKKNQGRSSILYVSNRI